MFYVYRNRKTNEKGITHNVGELIDKYNLSRGDIDIISYHTDINNAKRSLELLP